jgi:hypothetical protein
MLSQYFLSWFCVIGDGVGFYSEIVLIYFPSFLLIRIESASLNQETIFNNHRKQALFFTFNRSVNLERFLYD